MTDAADPVILRTRCWIERAVVGLNLCPFAKAPLARGRVRFVHTDAADPARLRDVLEAEMRLLVDADPADIETTLVIHPRTLVDFLDFNDFLDVADDALELLGFDGVLQVASFHPDYRFADSADDDLGNATNRSPYPTLQLLREASVDRAVEAFPDPDAIVDANLRTLEALGADGWAALEAGCKAAAGGNAPA